MNMLNFLCVLVLARAAAVADAQCTASTDSSKDGADGSFYCVNGGTIGGTTGTCTCTGCDSGYSGTSCQTPNQACSDDTTSLTCTAPAIKDADGTCEAATCASADFGDATKACCKAPITAADATCDNGEDIADGTTSCTCKAGFFGGGPWVSGLTYPACTACKKVVNQKICPSEPCGVGDGPGLTCTDGTDSTVARCIDGYAPLAPTSPATAHTCTACNPVANANADAAPTCPAGKDRSLVDACAVGYWRERTLTAADLCKACPDDANKATGTTVSCDPNPNNLATIGNLRLHGFCKAGYHLVRGQPYVVDGSSGTKDECTLCTATAVCAAAEFLHGCEADTVPTCKACTAIANMASSGALTCTSQYDSKVTPATDAGCASQYSLIKVAVGADGETHTCIDETHHSCAGTGPEDTGAGCENGNTPVGVSHAATRTTATLLLAGAMLAVTLIGR